MTKKYRIFDVKAGGVYVAHLSFSGLKNVPKLPLGMSFLENNWKNVIRNGAC